MAWVNIYVPKPWCAGRGYCNADGRTKTWCYQRPPPHWWFVTLSGAVAPWEWLNKGWAVPVTLVEEGVNPRTQWQVHDSEHNTLMLYVTWLRHFDPGETRWYISVSLDITGQLINATSWRSGKYDPVTNWMALDAQDLLEGVRTPLWQAGDITCNLKVGTYGRIPANSCRGDYNGPWPP